ncbi:membrane protein insertase YidC [Bombilactobacillus folatiphilus]|uniref:Membrane protein insertase YidC n=1 Tax=Bombilactobacillus folatiphilus TaxID=2923362 RepID=A0ABY4PAB7_9LACO|nr:membrane protein insertase YidC [Bombilactobacillus folatiphilus]UQS82552.1 membrane protein insertase YidC [Bombilactobacillus folatiphilus]
MKKTTKRVLLLSSLLGILLLTAACSKSGISGTPKPPTSGPYGWVYRYLGIPFQNLMLYASNTIGGKNGYAWGIIIISFLVRLILLPLSLIQQKKSIIQQEKMKGIQPQLKLIQEQQKKAKTQEEQAAVSQLMMQVYSKNNIKLTGGLGCLPLLLQFPVFIGIYQAVQYSPEISKANFWGAPLSKPSLIITIIATAFYLLQSWISLKNVPAEQRQQMKTMLILSPAMTFFISLASSTALALYFLIGGIIVVLQQLISDYIITPRVRKQVDQELKETPIVEVVTKDTFQSLNSRPDSTEQQVQNQHLQQQHQKNRQRNAGRQQHPHK